MMHKHITVVDSQKILDRIKRWSSYIEENDAEEFARIIIKLIDSGCPEDVATESIESAYRTTANMFGS